MVLRFLTRLLGQVCACHVSRLVKHVNGRTIGTCSSLTEAVEGTCCIFGWCVKQTKHLRGQALPRRVGPLACQARRSQAAADRAALGHAAGEIAPVQAASRPSSAEAPLRSPPLAHPAGKTYTVVAPQCLQTCTHDAGRQKVLWEELHFAEWPMPEAGTNKTWQSAA